MKHLLTLLKSKRVWLNVAGIAVTFSGTVPPATGVKLIAVANIITKVIDMVPANPGDSDAPQPPSVPNFPSSR